MMDQWTCSTCRRLLANEEFDPINDSGPRLRDTCRTCTAAEPAIRKHGLTAEHKRDLAEQQDGCALCHRTTPGQKGWVVDHDRACCATDKSCPDCRRGILCQWCNNALGYAMDDPALLRRMADYLELGTRIDPDLISVPPQSTDQVTESLRRLYVASRNGRTRRTDEEVSNPLGKDSPSVPRARVFEIQQLATTAALRASQQPRGNR